MELEIIVVGTKVLTGFLPSDDVENDDLPRLDRSCQEPLAHDTTIARHGHIVWLFRCTIAWYEQLQWHATTQVNAESMLYLLGEDDWGVRRQALPDTPNSEAT